MSCISCVEEMGSDECPASQLPCGHHCNHSWTHDVCCWCENAIGEKVVFGCIGNQFSDTFKERGLSGRNELCEPTQTFKRRVLGPSKVWPRRLGGDVRLRSSAAVESIVNSCAQLIRRASGKNN